MCKQWQQAIQDGCGTTPERGKDQQTPRSHAAQDFIFVHDELADEENAGCDTCHGKIAFGTNNRTFCANSGCHDSSWTGFGKASAESTF